MARHSEQKPVENSGVCWELTTDCSELAIECWELTTDGSEFAFGCLELATDGPEFAIGDQILKIGG